MAKLPKKKLTKPAKPAPKPPAKTTKAKKPKTVAKPKTTKVAKPPAKTSKAAAAKQPKKATPTKTSTGTKPKTAVKLSKSTKAKPPKKPTKPAAVQSLMEPDPGPIGGNGAPPAGGDGVAATPLITFPMANATVPAGMDLIVNVSTNRADLGYTVTIQDITPPGPAPAPTAFPGPNPTTNPFSVTIPAANLAAGRMYRILVTLDTASSATPHTDSVITINT